MLDRRADDHALKRCALGKSELAELCRGLQRKLGNSRASVERIFSDVRDFIGINAFKRDAGADFDSWEALAAYKADTLRDNVIQYVETIAEVRAKVEYER